ncbi:MAG TPA: hypothetical protein VE175_00305 [Woeseiaceae bacterium]|jgi:hypothetical protein|nr:hypothetical protein [Woeseiaceae bacterium]
MQDSKDLDRASESPLDEQSRDGQFAADADAPTNEDGWLQYRRWISKAPAPARRRSGVDPSLYTWKGYRQWAKQVKRNWSDN